MSYQVIVSHEGGLEDQAPICLTIVEGESLLAASERCLNKTIAVGCRGGGCGICRVRILSGDYRCKVMSREHISPEDQLHGVVLACRVYPESDLLIRHEVVKAVKKPIRL